MSEDALDSSDHLVRAMAERGFVRILGVRSTHVGRALFDAHKPLATAGAALVRVATAALLMGGTIKGRDQLSVQFQGDGLLGELIATADAHGNVRATVHQPFIDLPPREDGKLDVARAVGQGQLIVTKNLGMREPYRGVVPIVNGGIAEDLAHYFATSEQKPTVMALGEIIDSSGVSSAGGFLLQLFPGHDEAIIDILEERIQNMPSVSAMLAEGEAPEAWLQRLFPDDLILLETCPVQMQCNCARERYERILITLGEAELEDMAQSDEPTILTCNFCNTHYTFDADALQNLVAQLRGGVN